MRFTFKREWESRGFMPDFSQSQIKNEPMLFSADSEFAHANGGPITKYFIEHVLPKNERWVIDSKVVMLMPGWWPCIPGWHHDDVPRSTPSSQPNYRNPEYRSVHYAAIVGDCSRTEYLATSQLDMPEVVDGVVYGKWNEIINKGIEAGLLHTYQIHPNEIIRFTWQDFHRGMKADKNGWRFFIRASAGTFRPITNEIRRQVQVYMPDPEAGW